MDLEKHSRNTKGMHHISACLLLSIFCVKKYNMTEKKEKKIDTKENELHQLNNCKQCNGKPRSS